MTVTQALFDTFKDLPIHALEWLESKRVYPNLADKFKLRYAPTLICDGQDYGERLILPCMVDNECVFWQARTFNSSDVIKRTKFVSMKGIKNHGWFCEQQYNNKLFIVEDVLSAIVLSDTCNVHALQGDHLSDNLAYYISYRYNGVVIWMDDDIAGKKAAQRIKKKFEKIFGKKRFIQVVNAPQPTKITLEEQDIISSYLKHYSSVTLENEMLTVETGNLIKWG